MRYKFNNFFLLKSMPSLGFIMDHFFSYYLKNIWVTYEIPTHASASFSLISSNGTKIYFMSLQGDRIFAIWAVRAKGREKYSKSLYGGLWILWAKGRGVCMGYLWRDKQTFPKYIYIECHIFRFKDDVLMNADQFPAANDGEQVNRQLVQNGDAIAYNTSDESESG